MYTTVVLTERKPLSDGILTEEIFRFFYIFNIHLALARPFMICMLTTRIMSQLHFHRT